MKLHCPHCGVKGSAEDSYIGRKVKCPKCQGIFAVQPDMALGLSEDAALLSPTPVESSLSADEVETTTITDDGIAETETDGDQSPLEAEEQIVVTEDLAEPETAHASPDEEALDWEDVASEIDLQSAEAEEGEEQEELPADSPVEEILLQDEFDNPADDPDFSAEVDGQTEDEISEEIIVIEEDGQAEVEVTDVPEATESVAITENDEKKEPEDQGQLVEKTKEVEKEPYGIDQEQCWQCGKKESVGESFIAKDGRLYCMDCVPAEEAEKSIDTNQNIDDSAPKEDVTDKINDKSSLGKLIGKAWLKIKKALSS